MLEDNTNLRDQLVEVFESATERAMYSADTYDPGYYADSVIALLVERDRKVKEEAWSEGHAQAMANVAWLAERKSNPYSVENMDGVSQ